MTYEYKCTKCGLITEYNCSIKEDRPKTLTCICGGVIKFDWGQYSSHTILIPERHKA